MVWYDYTNSYHFFSSVNCISGVHVNSLTHSLSEFHFAFAVWCDLDHGVPIPNFETVEKKKK